MFKQDTIAAIATAPLPAGVAIIRVSGPKAWAAVTQLSKKLAKANPRQAIYDSLIHNDTVLDQALILGFKAPNSFTGEDVVEIQCHGGQAVTQSILSALLQQEGVRHAEAGEYTRRAVLSGKMDLTAAEGLADLIAAQTEAQQKQALRQLDGQLGQQFENWRQAIMHMVAHVEAGIDFPDEELDILADARVAEQMTTLKTDLEDAIKTNAGERLRDGFRIAIIGKPNAGKSTLTNLLTGKETAIVSPIEGTTRDVVETHLNIGGFPVLLADTAGLRASDDVIEQEGVKRANLQAQQADLILALIDAAEWPNIDTNVEKLIQAGKTLLIISKTDQTPLQKVTLENYPIVKANLQNNDTLQPILQEVEKLIKDKFATSQENALITRQRHRAAIEKTTQHLQRGLDLIANPRPDVSLTELLAQDLRSAAATIGTVTGKTTSEDVLDLVFSTFCIGK